ncbi:MULTISPECIES: terminase [Acetobacter]|uniref:Prophage terminase small subunit n=3 Tax=Acetobacter TaxID=434 RepID=A0A401WUQ5_ACEPA|nr:MULTISPECIES: terminase [Acetobacter]ASL41267.1 terminase [Acetobacter oryzifermentans]AXM99411.1 terminase [Acetobacter pomorum]KAA8393551.1 terminase [Acetobacter sp. DmW_125128]KAA8394724.1 terminase [Acetobacter sp. DmW_125124]KAA8400867.1 terminase [Acetobacter sp. DmW_125127]
MPKKTDTDWHAIEADFRAGALSNRQIAKKHGVAESTLRKRIASGGWVRTSAQKVRKNTKTAHQPAHNPQRNPALPREKLPSTGRRSAANVDERMDEMVSRLLGELEDTTSHLGEISKAIELETADDTGSRRRDAMLKAITIKERTESLHKLRQTHMMGVTGSGKKKGVKEERREAAEKAASGKFSRMSSPKLVVNNGK